MWDLPGPGLEPVSTALVGGFFFLIKKKFIYLFIYLSLAALGLQCCERVFSSCSEQGLLFVEVRGLLLLQSMGSRCVGFSSCGTRAQ